MTILKFPSYDNKKLEFFEDIEFPEKFASYQPKLNDGEIAFFGRVVNEPSRVALEKDGIAAVSRDWLAPQLTGDKITIRVNSPGGSYPEMSTILNDLENFEGEIVLVIDGIIGSAATLMVQYANEVYTGATSEGYFHEAVAIQMGYADDMADAEKSLRKTNKVIAGIYDSFMDLPEIGIENAAALMKGDSGDGTFLVADEMIKSNFADNLIDKMLPASRYRRRRKKKNDSNLSTSVPNKVLGDPEILLDATKKGDGDLMSDTTLMDVRKQIDEAAQFQIKYADEADKSRILQAAAKIGRHAEPTLDAFNAELAFLDDRKPNIVVKDADEPTVSNQTYSLSKMLDYMGEPDSKTKRDAVTAELELSNEYLAGLPGPKLAKGDTLQGIPLGAVIGSDTQMVNLHAQLAKGKELAANSFTAAGFIPTMVDFDNMIEVLLADELVLSMVDIMPGLVGSNISIPAFTANPDVDVRITSASATQASDVTEGNAPADKTYTITAYDMKARMVITEVSFTHLTGIQTLGRLEGYLRRLIRRVIRQKFIDWIVNGSGTNGNPTGILNTTGIGSKTFTATNWTNRFVAESGTNPGGPAIRSAVYDSREAVSAANANLQRSMYFLGPALEPALLQIPSAANVTGRAVLEDGRIAGRPAVIQNHFGTGNAQRSGLFGDLSEVLLGLWQGVQILYNPFSNPAQPKLQAMAYADVLVKHAGAFSKITQA